MALKMMDTAQPNYLERLRIVWVVFLRFTAAFSYRAWLAFQQSSSLVYVCIRPRIGPLFLFFSERIPGWPCFSHVGRMAGFAVTLPYPVVYCTWSTGKTHMDFDVSQETVFHENRLGASVNAGHNSQRARWNQARLS